MMLLGIHFWARVNNHLEFIVLRPDGDVEASKICPVDLIRLVLAY